MVEKNILAYFKTPDEADAAAAKLNALRAIDVNVDRFSKYPGSDTGYDSVNPISGDISSLAGLTMGADITSRSAGILASADVSASGMSDGNQDGPTGRDILLSAVVPEEVYERAIQVIEDHHGMI